jgi:hypothetical protein
MLQPRSEKQKPQNSNCFLSVLREAIPNGEPPKAEVLLPCAPAGFYQLAVAEECF